MLLLNTLHVLSPFRGLVSLMRLSRGFSPPAVFFRTSGAYLADSNKFISAFRFLCEITMYLSRSGGFAIRQD